MSKIYGQHKSPVSKASGRFTKTWKLPYVKKFLSNDKAAYISMKSMISCGLKEEIEYHIFTNLQRAKI